MEATATKREILRTIHRDWSQEVQEGNAFADSVTIDPHRAMAAWSQLSIDTFEHEVASYPALMHKALVAHLLKRSGRGGR